MRCDCLSASLFKGDDYDDDNDYDNDDDDSKGLSAFGCLMFFFKTAMWGDGEVMVRCFTNTSPAGTPLNTGGPYDLVRCWAFLFVSYPEKILLILILGTVL